ncbi:hypothetical protein LTS14_007028 [Recurvomyces mirabilis]|uniref:uncharacterized protein n=1 Tax=Recurvomyces mirabilis TaxID=574656 RepID=UPI002DDE863A|nr:hypothetical protein LTS14_007028 [Recurvomyces mirabilis]
MHLQSLLLTLAPALVLGQGTAAPSIGAFGNSSYALEQEHYIAQLREEVHSLKDELEKPCETPTGSNAVTRASGSAPATYTAAWDTAFDSGSISRGTPTAVRSYPAASSDGTASIILSGPSGQSSLALSSVAASASTPYPSASGTNGSAIATASGRVLSSGVSTTSATSSTAASSMTSSSSSSSTSVSSSYVPSLSDFTVAQIESGEAWKNISELAMSRMQARQTNGSCTPENARVRTEFRKMSNAQRKSYTDAITCLHNNPPRYVEAASDTYPGVLNRYDEYVATHINLTYNIHGTADFLAWHRNMIHQYETDLIEVCGYSGNLPYWDWAQDAAAVDQSELFNGDEFSMGSNGVYIPDRNGTFLGLMGFTFPPGTGGGCVHSGPFSENFNTSLGPLDSPYGNNVANQYDLNSRCLVRDLNSWFSSQFNTYTNVTDLVLGETQVEYFQSLMQGFLGDNKLGIHGGGHWLGGGPSQLEDFHSSPNDPIFFLHHAMIDRIWTVWQYLDIENRLDEIYGTHTLQNSPASADMTLQDNVVFGLVGENEVLSSLMDTYGGRFCYRYE